jgi:hypothetical protein
VLISESVFGALTQNRSSLEPSLILPPLPGTPRIESGGTFAIDLRTGGGTGTTLTSGLAYPDQAHEACHQAIERHATSFAARPRHSFANSNWGWPSDGRSGRAVRLWHLLIYGICS